MNPLPLFLTFVIGEIVAIPIFAFMRSILGPPPKEGDDAVVGHSMAQAMAKGIVERAFIYISLLAGVPHALTALGALKIATRISENPDDKISNDYFLIGNLTSIGLAVCYYWIAQSPP